jgi:hypothetical protein
MPKLIINKDKIIDACQSGFLDFIKSQESIKINGIDIPIVHPANYQGYCLVTPNCDFEKAVSELSELGLTNIIFNVNYKVDKRLANGESKSIEVYANDVQGALTIENDSFIFRIGNTFFRERWQ